MRPQHLYGDGVFLVHPIHRLPPPPHQPCNACAHQQRPSHHGVCYHKDEPQVWASIHAPCKGRSSRCGSSAAAAASGRQGGQVVVCRGQVVTHDNWAVGVWQAAGEGRRSYRVLRAACQPPRFPRCARAVTAQVSRWLVRAGVITINQAAICGIRAALRIMTNVCIYGMKASIPRDDLYP